MITTDQEQWLRVRGRLRAEVGEDIFSSWFARMELEGLNDETVHLSVPTRFLKSWIQAHYAEKVLVLLARRTAQSAPHRSCGANRGDPVGDDPGQRPRTGDAGA